MAKDRVGTLNQDPYRIPSDVFVAAGHYSASFDLPNHGDRIDEHGEGLAGMAAAMTTGVDVFAAIRSTAAAVIRICGNLGIGESPRFFVAGTSRGGLAALHSMAACPQISAAALFAPVTELSFLREFAHLAESPTLQRSNATSLIPDLPGKPVFIAIGEDDPRVSTALCRRFHAALKSHDPESQAQFLMDKEAQGHRVSDAAYRLGAAFLLDRHRAPQPAHPI